MKTVLIAVCLLLLAVLQAPVVLAKEINDYRLEADQFYVEQNFKKAYKIYYKLAKKGDHYSQARLSQMYANGEGKGVDLTEAYAWSVLATEGRAEGTLEKSELLLQQTNDKTLAEKKAAKLMKRYGVAALQEKERKKEIRKFNHTSGGCTGSKIGCSGR